MSDPFIGEIRMFAGSYAPQGWLLCDGTSYPVQSYQALFTLIGSQFGGNGNTTFAVPDLRGTAVVGSGKGPNLTNRPYGEIAGMEQVTLTVDNLPAHTHPLACSTAAATATVPDSTMTLATVANTLHLYGDISQGTKGTRTFNSDAITASPGGHAAHDNMMPSIAITYIICWNGIFPSFN